MNPDVDWFFDKAGKWRQEVFALRTLALESGLEEVLKWGCPCYVSGKKNIVLIHHFKEYCALLFFKGALMQDPENLLIQQTDNVQSARQMRFTNHEQIAASVSVIVSYIHEAIRVESSGVKVPMRKTTEYSVPEELEQQFEQLPALKKAFEALTPGRQRAYLLHFAQPKQAKTREARIAKCMEAILNGKGLNE